MYNTTNVVNSTSPWNFNVQLQAYTLYAVVVFPVLIFKMRVA